MSYYEPSVTITAWMLSPVGDIAFGVGKLPHWGKVQQADMLKTIQGSLVIEGNTLSIVFWRP